MRWASHSFSSETKRGLCLLEERAEEAGGLAQTERHLGPRRRSRLRQVCYARVMVLFGRSGTPRAGTGTRGPSPSLPLCSPVCPLGCAVTAEPPTAAHAWPLLSFLGFSDMWSHLLGGAVEKTFGPSQGLHQCSATDSHSLSIHPVPGTVLCALEVAAPCSLEGGS